jgi:hypothetical protein
MANSPGRNWLLAAAVVVSSIAVASIASADSSQRPGVHNGVVTACVEPLTKGNRATSGDLNVLVCLKGYKKISWNIRGPRGLRGPAGPAGPQGTNGAKGDPGPPPVSEWGPFDLTGQDDHGCITATSQEVWAHDDETRFYEVSAAQDGSGYFVTRYDVSGTYTTVVGAHDPGVAGCTGAQFTSAQTGPFNGVWTKKVTINAATPVDYNPDADPTVGSWDDFLTAVFGVNSSDSHVSDVSYEFDYYNSCHNHWRDSFYGGAFLATGGIGICP